MTNTHRRGDVAIIGMACRVAGANTTGRLWENLASSVDVQRVNPRFSGFFSENGGPKKGHTNVDRGYYVDDDLERFDNAFFAIPPIEAGSMDPQQRMLLEVTYEAVENAGLPLARFTGTNTAVYTGMTWSDYSVSLSRDLDMTPKYMSTGGCNAIAANRVSYFFDLHGPSVVVDTACSSTMVGFHQAVQDLQSGEAEMAVVNGSNLLLNPDVFVHMSELGFLSPTGRCRSFDADGNGYVRAEGIIAMLLKPLDKAIQDGDPIRAVIRGTRLNQDGRTQGITQPNSEAQRANMEALYSRAGLDPLDVQYFEAHGTGTAVGDPLELSAIDAIYRNAHADDNKLVVGSVKSNIGHLEAVAALAGIAKTVESLERGLIPPQMHFVTPNPKIDFTAIQIPTSVTPWPKSRDGVRRAAVNSFGFGGTNGHTVLESAPQLPVPSGDAYERNFLFKLSAASPASLATLTQNLVEHLEKDLSTSAQDLAHTLLSRRSTFKNTNFVIANSSETLLTKLRNEDWTSLAAAESVSKQRVGFIFTGQGAQWPAMGKQLLQSSPLFRSVVQRCAEVLRSLPDGPSWEPAEELSKDKTTSSVYQSSFSQPLCTILQIGLVELWRSWGVEPVAVVGHSSGEVAAGYCAGHLSLRDAVVVAYYRGLHLSGAGPAESDDASTKRGSMCAIGAGEAESVKLLKPFAGRLSLACVNSPGSCTLSGDEDAIVEIVAKAKEQGLFCRQLRVESAYHSHHMLPKAPVYRKSMVDAGVKPAAGDEAQKQQQHNCNMYSSVRGRKLDRSECLPTYWEENMTSTVRFSAAVTAMMQDAKVDALVEIGPHAALKGPTEDILAALKIDDVPYSWSCTRGEPDLVSMLQNAARLVAVGVSLKLDNVNAYEIVDAESGKVVHQRGSVVTNLPRYAWDHSKSFWGETELSQNYRHRPHPRHELLGTMDAMQNPMSRTWRNLLTLDQVKWLKELMEVQDIKTLPPFIMVLIAVEACKNAGLALDGSVTLDHLVFHSRSTVTPSFDSDEAIMELQTKLDHDKSAEHSSIAIFARVSYAEYGWVKLFSADIGHTPKHIAVLEKVEVTEQQSLQDLADSFSLAPAQGLENVQFSLHHATGSLASDIPEKGDYAIDPVVLDSVLRLPQSMLLGTGQARKFTLSAIKSLNISLAKVAGEAAPTLRLVSSGVSNANSIVSATLSNDDAAAAALGLEGATYTATGELLRRQPPLSSRFFRPVEKLDISYPEKLTSTDLADVVDLITHKWPAADFALVGLPARDVEVILSVLLAGDSSARPRFRSATVVGSVEITASSRVRVVDELEAGRQFRVLCCPSAEVDKYKQHVLDGGLILTAKSDGSEEPTLLEDSVFVSESIKTPSGDSWSLRRTLVAEPDAGVSASLRVFCSSAAEQSTADLGPATLTKLDELFSGTPTHGDNSTPEGPWDVVVMDCEERSILLDTPGDKLMPWIQSLIPHLRHMLWVSKQTARNPFNGVAASFVRTLCAEHPTLRATHLVFQDESDPSRIAGVAKLVLAGISRGDREGELVVREGQVYALRHVPDDELSAGVGLLPARKAETPLHSGDHYQISSETIGRVDLVKEPSISRISVQGDQQVQVKVLASLVDHEDVLRLRAHPAFASSALGLFFVGVVDLTDANGRSKSQTVFGWSPGAHKSQVVVPASQIRHLREGVNVSAALVRHALHTTAHLLVVRGARVQTGDRVHVSGLPKGLQSALIPIVEDHGGVVLVSTDGEPDVVISLDDVRGLTVNGKTVNLASLLERHGLPDLPHDHSVLDNVSSSSSRTFSISQLEAAFDHGEEKVQNIEPRVLLHSDDDSLSYVDALVSYKSPQRLFRPDGAYILLGGLGGVGQQLIRWMVAGGAKNIATISRSGINSASAREFAGEIAALGASLQILQGDASNQAQLEAALSEVRKKHHIIGCINLTILLDDAPLATMTGSQWDGPLQVKVRTSWYLHQATLQDELDFFILFSSCVTMIGSRMQAAYSTGNMFLNQLAIYRRALGLTAVSLLVPALRGFGVLENQESLLKYMDNAGYFVGDRHDLFKLVEAALLESSASASRPVIESGLQMFQTVDGKLQAKESQTQVFWAEFPEFGHLLDHTLGADRDGAELSLLERLQGLDDSAAQALLLKQFLQSLSSILGYSADAFDPASPIAAYGLDSLNAVACRYWFFKELGLEISVFDVLGAKSIRELVAKALSSLREASGSIIPAPVHYEEVANRPLSRSQSRLWFLHRYLDDKTAFNLLLVCHITGKADAALLEQAWAELIRRHDVLHSGFVDTKTGPEQVVLLDAPFHFEVISCSDEAYNAELVRLTEVARTHAYRVEAGELVHCWMLQSPSSSALLLGSHHLAWDRASSPTIFDEVTQLYKGLVAGQTLQQILPPVPYQFVDYTLWQEQVLSTPELVDPLVAYWKQQLQDAPESVSLLPFAKTDRRPAIQQMKTGHVSFSLPADLSSRIKEFCTANALTSFMFMTAGIAALVNRLTGDGDILIGISDSDRGHSDFDKLVGFTVNMLAIRCRPTPEQSYADYLQDLRQTCLDAYKHRSLPFDYLLQAIDVPRRTAHSPVFQIMVNYQVHGAFPQIEFGDFQFSKYDHYNARTQTDFSVDIEETQQGALDFTIEYDEAIYDTKGMDIFASLYKTIVEDVLDTAGARPVGELQLVSVADSQRIASYLSPPLDQGLIDKCYSSLFDTFIPCHAAHLSSKTAIVDSEQSMSYAELQSAVTRATAFFRSRGLSRGQMVAIACEPSVGMAVAIYSLWTLGCTYLPVIDVPDERLRSVFEDVAVSQMLVHDDKQLSRGVKCGLKRSSVFRLEDMLKHTADAPLLPETAASLKPEDNACCIFTSGSTGRPKGLYLTHGGIRLWHEGFHHELLGTSAEDRMLLVSSLNFDMSLVSIYSSMVCGATLVVAPREAIYSPSYLVDYVVDQRVSSVMMTPTQFMAMASAPNKHRLRDWMSLRNLSLGGEVVSTRCMAAFFGLGLTSASLWNAYGPSETTVTVSVKRVDLSEAASPSASLGPPMFPAQLRLVDENSKDVPFGMPGQLLIGGPQLCTGYINRPELTAAKFVSDTITAPDGTTTEATFYQTGDSFRLDADGTLQYIGRVGGDRQVKIRGQRTELDEIEQAIWQSIDAADGLLAVEVTAVAVVYRKEEESLVAYLSTSAKSASEDGGLPPSKRDVEDVTRYLRSTLQPVLPVHMRPGVYVSVAELPRTVSGKTDYRTIASWPPPIVEASSSSSSSSTPSSSGSQDESTPRSMQQEIAMIWGEITGVEASVRPSDDFFSMGGHSLALMQVQAAIASKFGVTLSLAQMFSEPTLEGMERLVLELQGPGSSSVANGHVNGSVSASQQSQANTIDWAKETALPEGFAPITAPRELKSPKCIAVTGGSTLGGAHFVSLILNSSEDMRIICLAEDSKKAVLDGLDQCDLLRNLTPEALDRIIVLPGNLKHPTLGLGADDVARLDAEVDIVYNFSSDVSLFGNYNKLRAGNLGVIKFLISLARGNIGRVKPLVHFSTWATAHLQTWHETTTNNGAVAASPLDTLVLDEQPMSHITPGTQEGSGAYLKVRWACEAVLQRAAEQGLPVSIVRASMAAMPAGSGVALPRTDINRRIIQASLQTGLVPDFGSARGGGMSWVTFDFLAAAIRHLTITRASGALAGGEGKDSRAEIWHLVSDKHVTYRDMAALLGEGTDGYPLRPVAPKVWFAALKAEDDPEMEMQAEVLDKWCKAGWVPFAVDATKTLRVLEEEAGIRPPVVTRELLLKSVVGEEGF